MHYRPSRIGDVLRIAGLIKGRCVRAEVDGFTPWELPESAPLWEMHFLLHFEGEKPHGILITDGRVAQQYDQGVRKG